MAYRSSRSPSLCGSAAIRPKTVLPPPPEPTDESPSSSRAQALKDQLKSRANVAAKRLSAAQKVAAAKVAKGSAGLRGGLSRAVTKVRTGLDLPSRREMTNLTARVEELDEKLGRYETAAGAREKRDAQAN